MFKYIFALFFVITLSFKVIAATPNQLDVLIVFDKYTINTSNDPVENLQLENYSKKFIDNLNKTMKNSGLDEYIVFNNVLSEQTHPYLHLYFSEPLENLDDILTRYNVYVNESKLNNNLIVSELDIYQYYYKADVVIAIMLEPSYKESGYCGISLRTPSYAQDGYDVDPDEIQKGGYNSKIFINGKSGCMDDITTVSHEWGHSAGLFHGNVTDTCDGLDEEDNQTIDCYAEYKNLMFDNQAAGYVSSKDSVYFQTLMGDYNRYISPYYERLNRFSDINAFDCKDAYQCGSQTSSAVELLKKFAYHYSQRSEWYIAESI